MSKTIVYYTSNREKPEFEEKVRQHFLSVCGALPIISVSQKPIDLGLNVVVGDIGLSYESEFKQIFTGVALAKTEYVVFAEADFLYPKEYFEFEPKGDNIYRNENVWVIFAYSVPRRTILHRYYKKPFSLGTQICKRDYILNQLMKVNMDKLPFTKYSTETACISFKTGDGMTRRNVIQLDADHKKVVLPYWGDARKLAKKYI